MLAPTPASPESAGMSKSAFDRLEAHLKHRYVDAGRFPGTQLLVYRRGKVVHSAVQGFADLERKVPVKDDTIFRIYSMTKPITSTAFMMLFEEGRVALDEPVHKYIPEWKNLGVFVAGTAPAFLTRPPTGKRRSARSKRRERLRPWSLAWPRSRWSFRPERPGIIRFPPT
jgi:CubicO group peptidase (beta-lactamase class C family)